MIPVDPALDAQARTVANLVPVMLAYWDASLRCTFANRAYELWCGVEPEAMIGKAMHEFLGPLYVLNLPYIEGALRGEPQEFEREIPDPAGGPPRYALANYVPDIEDGRVKGFGVVVSNITERKRLADELLQANTALIETLLRVKTLESLLPICAWCRRVRDDEGYWGSLESYLARHTDIKITHSLCESCAESKFPDHFTKSET